MKKSYMGPAVSTPILVIRFLLSKNTGTSLVLNPFIASSFIVVSIFSSDICAQIKFATYITLAIA